MKMVVTPCTCAAYSLICFKSEDGGYGPTFGSCTKHRTHNPPHSGHNKNQILHHVVHSVTRCGFCFPGSVILYDNEEGNWRILTNKEIYASIKKPTIIETIRLNRLRWFGHVQRMDENRIPKKVLYMNWEATRLRDRPGNRWQDEVREDGRLVG